MTEVTLCYQDESMVVVDKPKGLLVHRTAIDSQERRALVQSVRHVDRRLRLEQQFHARRVAAAAGEMHRHVPVPVGKIHRRLLFDHPRNTEGVAALACFME